MDFVISHISALEYWRLVEQPGMPAPLGTTRAALPTAPVRTAIASSNVLPLLSTPYHCLCSTKQKNVPTSSIASHHQKAALPPGAIRKISPRIGVASPELALMQMATKLSFAELVGLMCEFCGRFSIQDNTRHGMFPRSPLTSTKRIQAFASPTRYAAGIEPFRVASAYALDGSRSPAETAAALLLTLPRARGGYGLRGAQLNRTIQLATKAKRTAGVAQLEPDILWPGKRICIEYDSSEFHCEEKRIANDARRKNALLLSNLHVITLTKIQMANRYEMDKIAKQASTKMGKRWHRPDLQKQVTLRNELLEAASIILTSSELSMRAGQQLPFRAD